MRLFPVLLLTFLVQLMAENVLYSLEEKPVLLSTEGLAGGRASSGVSTGDFVKVKGTPNLGEREKPQVAVASRYEVAYYYFELEQTGGRLLIQQAEEVPNLGSKAKRSFSGRLDTVGGVIFHDTTREALRATGLPTNESVVIVETGEKPADYRRILPA